MGEEIKIERSSGNIFFDLGFGEEEAKEELPKAQLGAEIFRILAHRKLTQTMAAEILGVKQPEISRLKSGRFPMCRIVKGKQIELWLRCLYAGDRREIYYKCKRKRKF